MAAESAVLSQWQFEGYRYAAVLDVEHDLVEIGPRHQVLSADGFHAFDEELEGGYVRVLWVLLCLVDKDGGRTVHRECYQWCFVFCRETA